jgi:hypothetical protein
MQANPTISGRHIPPIIYACSDFVASRFSVLAARPVWAGRQKRAEHHRFCLRKPVHYEQPKSLKTALIPLLNYFRMWNKNCPNYRASQLKKEKEQKGTKKC